MRLETLWAMMGGRDVRFTLRALRSMQPMHRVSWLAAASRHGVLVALAEGPLRLSELCERFVPVEASRPAFAAWLRHGCLLQELRVVDDRYHLRGLLARNLADPKHGPLAAYVQGLVEVHHRALYESMDRIAAGETLHLEDLDAPLVARISEMLAPILRETLDDLVPTQGALSFLELGCGSGHYLGHACRRNPGVSAVGVDFDDDVVASAREGLVAEGLHARAEIVAGDLRAVALDRSFDLVAMFNLIYYFPPGQREAVLAKVAGHVAPGGTLVLTSSCHGGTIGNNVLDVWFSAMPECGPLPTPEVIVQALTQAGLVADPPRRLMPGEEYYRFVARRA